MTKMVLREEYNEALLATKVDGDPGARLGTLISGTVASPMVLLLGQSKLWLPAVLFAWSVTVAFALTYARHRRTIRRWREQEAERLSRIEAEKFLKEHKS